MKIKQERNNSPKSQIPNILSRIRSLSEYYKNPNRCLLCSNIIDIKEGQKVRDAKIKKFCSHNCAANYNNKLRVKDKVKVEKEGKISVVLGRTKGFYKELYKDWWSARVPIAKLARRIYLKSNKLKSCSICGYDKHFEVCHIKAVSEFEDTVTIEEINNINNLTALCRNCHWEVDNNVTSLKISE